MGRMKPEKGRDAATARQERFAEMVGCREAGGRISMVRQNVHWQSGSGQEESLLAGACSEGQQDDEQGASVTAASVCTPLAASRTRTVARSAIVRRNKTIFKY